MTMKRIYCCGCQGDVKARLTDGSEIFPYRFDLALLPFWKCDTCGNYVGCHHRTGNRTHPLGVIATQEIRDARRHIHDILDPAWRSGKIPRRTLYAVLAKETGVQEYHTAKIRTLDEARAVYRIVRRIIRNLTPEGTPNAGFNKAP